MTETISLPDVHVARYRFTLHPLDTIHLPPYKGSALRGGFGHALKRLVCYREAADCAPCGLGNDCVYGYLFETSPPQDAEALRNYTAVARPFVIEPPLERRETFEPGEPLVFCVALIGRGIAYLPYLLLAFQGLGQSGLGRTRGRFTLHRVTVLGGDDEWPVYDSVDRQVRDHERSAGPAEMARTAAALSPDRLVVSFRTPTRLKHGGQWIRAGPPFHVLIKALLGRVSSLSYFHCGQRWDVDFRGWIDRAREVQMVDGGAGWANWERYSGRQQRRIRMGGLVGAATYEGHLRPFLPLLALGELVHVGKGTVFGNGQYRVANG